MRWFDKIPLDPLKVGILGSHGTGKTTLVDVVEFDFANDHIVHTVEEVASRCPHSINRETTPQSQEWILREQIRAEMDAPHDCDLILSDRTTLDNLAYSYTIFHKFDPHDFISLERMAIRWMDTYDILAYLPVEFGLEDNGIRDTDPTFQEEVDGNIRALIRRYDLPIRELRPDFNERWKEITQVIEDIL